SHEVPAGPGADASSEWPVHVEQESATERKSAFARGAATARDSAAVAFHHIAERAKTSIAQVAARVRNRRKEGDGRIRRTTAPPPAGPLHASGRKVVRGELEESSDFDPPATSRFKITKKKVILASALSTALVVGGLVAKKSWTNAPLSTV